MKRIHVLTAVALFLAVLLVACSAAGGREPAAGTEPTPATDEPATSEVTPEGTPADEVTHGGPIVDYVSLVDALRFAGTTVEPVEGLQQPFFEPMAQVVEVNGERLQIFEFADEEAALAAAETVSENGTSVGPTMLTWQDTPHFYRVDRLIVLYVGSDAGALDLLQEVLGEQFAGG